MEQQARTYGVEIVNATVTALSRTPDGLEVSTDKSELRARTILLALGVVNKRPRMPDALHAEAVSRGLLRYCPVCDGFEVTDQDVGIIGTGSHGVTESEFLRSYTDRLTLIAPEGGHALNEDEKQRLRAGGIEIEESEYTDFKLLDDRIEVVLGAKRRSFFSIYPALGTRVRSEIATNIGAKATDNGCILTDTHLRTNVEGLYAAGDVVLGLDQISFSMGQGGIAATTIRNDLAKQRPLRR